MDEYDSALHAEGEFEYSFGMFRRDSNAYTWEDGRSIWLTPSTFNLFSAGDAGRAKENPLPPSTTLVGGGFSQRKKSHLGSCKHDNIG